MADNARKALEREKARLLEQAAAIDRDLAELDRIAAKYNLVIAPGSRGPTKRIRVQQKKKGRSKGTVASLIAAYKKNKETGYHKAKYQTRINYDSLLRRIEDDRGHEKLADLTPQDIQRFYEDWLPRGEAMAGSLVRMLRMLLGFGATELGDPDCGRLSVPFVLRKMRFKATKRRSERLTKEQANQIRAKAHEVGMPSIALAQALQTELGLGQKDVLGEWVPLSEPGSSDVIDQARGLKWVRGIRVTEIDQNLILRCATTKHPEGIDLKKSPTVLAELKKHRVPSSGALIICERTNQPWHTHSFRRDWRAIANACGIPPNVFNMDSGRSRDDQSADDEEPEKDRPADADLQPRRPSPVT
jgi:hypothetical protein